MEMIDITNEKIKDTREGISACTTSIVEGSISALLKDMPISPEDLLGKPIRDENGDRIGTIYEINVLLDTWYGKVNYGYETIWMEEKR